MTRDPQRPVVDDIDPEAAVDELAPYDDPDPEAIVDELDEPDPRDPVVPLDDDEVVTD